jgi:hypothetical protein
MKEVLEPTGRTSGLGRTELILSCEFYSWTMSVEDSRNKRSRYPVCEWHKPIGHGGPGV